jgi:hypothetical protein
MKLLNLVCLKYADITLEANTSSFRMMNALPCDIHMMHASISPAEVVFLIVSRRR